MTDSLGKMAWPFLTFDTKEDGDFFQRIEQLIEKENVGEIVLGMPRNMDGSIGKKGKEVLEFSKKLASRIKIPITFWDERLTTVESLRVLEIQEQNFTSIKRKWICSQPHSSFRDTWTILGQRKMRNRNPETSV